jgi:ABC-2 type transport system ATP-binding protein
LIEVQGLTKHYGSVVAVNDVTFRADVGAIVGLLGPNGAGKTTTLRMLAGVLGPTSGKIAIAGNDILESPLRARACLGYLAETSPLYPEMRVGDYLTYRAALKGIKRRKRREAVREALASTHCDDVIGVRVSHLSRGYRQRVGLADALLASPAVLLLDEPTAGLDPNQIRDVRELIIQLGQSRTILLSTHVLAEVEAICTEAVVIHRGQLVANGTLHELRAGRHIAEVALLVRDPNRLTPTICADVGWRLRPNTEGELESGDSTAEETVRFVVCPQKVTNSMGAELEQLIGALVKNGVGVRGVSQSRRALEAVFAELTSEVGKSGQ